MERLTTSVSTIKSDRTKSRAEDLKMQMSYVKGWTTELLNSEMMKFKLENKKLLDFYDEKNSKKLDIEGYVYSKYETEDDAYQAGHYKSFSKWLSENDQRIKH